MEIEISLCKNYKTRSQRNGKQTGENYTKNVATQTGVFKLIPKVPVHLKEKQIKPRYIETMPLLVLLRLFALYILWILLFGGRHAICHLSQTRHIKICQQKSKNCETRPQIAHPSKLMQMELRWKLMNALIPLTMSMRIHKANLNMRN